MAAHPILVVGAGISGLVAASELVAAGHEVTVVDKGRGVGGRMATRRMGDARIDHGAQFFTVRSDEFATLVSGWLADGSAREWCRGFGAAADGHPRYVGVGGMTAPAKSLAAGLDVRTATRLASIGVTPGGRWTATLEDGSALSSPDGPLEADAVVCTPPVPQTLDLLAAGGVMLGTGVAASLTAILYEPTLAALVVLDGPGAVPAPGGVQLADGPLSWVADNRAKGVSAVPALTLHARGDLSARRWDDESAATVTELLGAARAWTAGASALDTDLVRWRYATPVALHDERCLLAVDGDHPVVCAGDAFGEARVEGAARSGLAAAAAVLARLG